MQSTQQVMPPQESGPLNLVMIKCRSLATCTYLCMSPSGTFQASETPFAAPPFFLFCLLIWKQEFQNAVVSDHKVWYRSLSLALCTWCVFRYLSNCNTPREEGCQVEGTITNFSSPGGVWSTIPKCVLHGVLEYISICRNAMITTISSWQLFQTAPTTLSTRPQAGMPIWHRALLHRTLPL